MENKRILKKSLLYLIGTFSSRLLSSLLIPIYAFKVSSSDLGTFDNAQSWMNVLVPIVFLAIWEAILKFVLSEEDEKIKMKIISSSLVYILFVIILFIFTTVFYITKIQRIDNFILIITMILLNGIAQIWQYLARSLKRNGVYVFSGVLSTIVNLGSIIIFIYYFNLGVKSLFLAFILSQLTIFITIEMSVHILKHFSIKDVDIKILRKIIKYSSPLVLNLISSWLISGFGRIAITHYLGANENGLYSFANKFAVLITMLGSVISMSIIEESILSAKSNDFDKRFTKVIEEVFKLFEAIIILAMPAISLFYYLIRETEYYSSIYFVPLLLVYAVFMIMSTNIGAIFQVINKTQYQFITTVLGGGITVILSLTLINKMGVLSIIIGQVVGALVMLISRYIFANIYIRLKITWCPILVKILIFALISIICIKTSVVVIIISLAFTVLYIIVNYKEYIHLIKHNLFRRRKN